MRNRIFLDHENKRIPKSFFDNTIEPNINLKSVKTSVKTRWGVVSTSTLVRALPTHKGMFEGVNDFEFDQLQYSRIKVWTPVAILHETRDKKWYFIQAPYAKGWAQSRDIAIFNSRDELKTLCSLRVLSFDYGR